jgi:hypothetical protein
MSGFLAQTGCVIYWRNAMFDLAIVGVGAASEEAAPRNMSLVDMSGPLFAMPNGTTPNVQVVINTSAPAAEQQNKTPIYVTGVTDTRGFLSWLRVSCQRGPSAQIRGEKLMLVPFSAEGFRATVSALSSLDGSKAVIFLTFSQSRSCFLSPPDRPDLRRTDLNKFHVSLEFGLQSNRDLSSEVGIDALSRNCQAPFRKL